MNITLIAAIGLNNELGKDNDLIWSIPEDLKFFKEQTLNKHIVMGMNTYLSLPKKLNDRKYIVLTSKERQLGDDIVVCRSVSELLDYISTIDSEIMVIGGASIYNQMIDYANRILLTEIDATKEADVYFPKFNQDDWNRDILCEHVYNEISYKHVKYTRKKGL